MTISVVSEGLRHALIISVLSKSVDKINFKRINENILKLLLSQIIKLFF